MAVYTHITAADLTPYLKLFDIGALSTFSGITDGVSNTNYLLNTTQGKFILTLFEGRVHAEDLPFYISFMEYLHDQGIPCPHVVPGTSGEAVIPLNGKPAIITTFLDGSWPRQTESFHAAAVGKTLARMHRAGEKFKLQRSNTMSLPAWRELIESCGNKTDSIEPGLASFLQQELDYQEQNRPQNLPAGAVHADLFPDNVFFTGQQLTGVIDFYFSCTDAFAYDLMLTLNAWCFDTAGKPDTQKSAALLEAYQKERPLSAAEKAALPLLGRAAALRIVATRLYDGLHPAPGAVVRAKDPLEYVRILKFYQTGGFPA
ncbi:MAG: homoserine kinase [Alphaproteobacteria bacterium]|nr:homoserine kinase [Alphaproteobacteria bacterium]